MLALFSSLLFTAPAEAKEIRLGGCFAVLATDCLFVAPTVEYAHKQYSLGASVGMLGALSVVGNGKYYLRKVNRFKPFVGVNTGLYAAPEAAGYIYGVSAGSDVYVWRFILRGQLGYMLDSNSDTLGLDSPVSYGVNVLVRL